MLGLPTPICEGVPPTALAPMQDVTTLSFMRVLHAFGSPDYYFTEFFRVHAHSRLEPHILRSISENDTGRPVFAQLIGEHIPDLLRTVEMLEPYEVAGVDLNLGCPAPKVYKKNVGGGLLRDPRRIDEIFAALRACIKGRFTVKMRLGFEDTENYDAILESVRRHQVDMLSVHGRTVSQRYRGEVDYPLIAHAVQKVDCPVFANGNISSFEKAREVQLLTGCHGLMIGRAAIRNPWIFRQIRESYEGGEVIVPLLSDVRGYVQALFDAFNKPDLSPRGHLGIMKKFLNFVAQGVDAEGRFLYDMRRVRTQDELLGLCDLHMTGSQSDIPFACEPYDGLVARPNCED